MSSPITTVFFSHGRDSGPWGTKITAMSQIVREAGLEAVSVDYRGIDDPRLRVAKLLNEAMPRSGSLVLVGSSLGGHVSAAAAPQLKARGLFLLAPAFYMPGFEAHTPRELQCPAALVHGWNDAVVPVENSCRWAREQRAELHVLHSDHSLQDQIPAICLYLREFLRTLD